MKPTFTWHELVTTDTAAGGRFYADVVGVHTEPFPDPSMDYTLIVCGSGSAMGGLVAMPEAMAGMPSHWVGTVGVADADATAARVTELGGTVVAGPFDIPNVGRYASFRDPQGAGLAVLAPVPGSGQPAFDPAEHGRVGWNELWTSDPEAAAAFYGALFGWAETGTMDMGDHGTYRMFGNDGVHLGGIAAMMPGQPAPGWLFYLQVDDVAAAVERIANAGGQVVVGPAPIPGGGRFLIGVDPTGASFALMSA